MYIYCTPTFLNCSWIWAYIVMTKKKKTLDLVPRPRPRTFRNVVIQHFLIYIPTLYSNRLFSQSLVHVCTYSRFYCCEPSFDSCLLVISFQGTETLWMRLLVLIHGDRLTLLAERCWTADMLTLPLWVTRPKCSRWMMTAYTKVITSMGTQLRTAMTTVQ